MASSKIHKSLIAGLAAVVMAAGTPVAFAAESNTGSSADSTTTTVPSKSKRMTPEQRAAYAAAVKAYRQAESAIKKAFVLAVKTANEARQSAMKSATGKKARKAIAKAHAEALKLAKATRDAALAALGSPPAKPAN